MTLDGGQFIFIKELEIDKLFIGEKALSLLKTHVRQTHVRCHWGLLSSCSDVKPSVPSHLSCPVCMSPSQLLVAPGTTQLL